MFRKACEEDLPRIAQIHSDAWHEAYRDLVEPGVMAKVTPEERLQSWHKWFEVGGHTVWLMVEDDMTMGFIRLCPAGNLLNAPANYGELSHLYLDPDKIKLGYGHQLFELARRELASQDFIGMLLWTIEGNARARRFYDRHDMVTDGARRDDPHWLGKGVYEVRYVLPFEPLI